GEEILPPPSRSLRTGSLAGRFGPAVPALADTLHGARPESPLSPPLPASALAAHALLDLPEGARVALRADGLVLVRVGEGFTARVDSLRGLLPSGKSFK